MKDTFNGQTIEVVVKNVSSAELVIDGITVFGFDRGIEYLGGFKDGVSIGLAIANDSLKGDCYPRDAVTGKRLAGKSLTS